MSLSIQSIQFDHVSFGFENEPDLISEINFLFPMGEVVLFKGSTGSGVSTVMQLLAGLQQPKSGHYLINGENVTEMSFEEFLPYRLRIGYAFDLGGLIANQTLESNLILPLTYHKLMDRSEALKWAHELMSKMGIEKMANERPAHVTGSARRATVVLRAMIARPDLLLLDDPTVGLTKEMTVKLVSLIQELRRQGSFKNLFISSRDEFFSGCFDHTEVYLSKSEFSFPTGTNLKKAAVL